ncbi:hypothetical protein GDO81_011248 [Engystomops pustulosus]|uniref:Sorting nexin-31 n=1 Tax=Engystomops pustulosus TaxID=76066 RepID=A0AAV7BCT7_ENGPU|nr:hypothetical protein GDO81_011248 [Engystomops pustulosus]KAG8570379.1 hypothetical protein GDO81_011248 [Engystomops pustulosus]
MHISIPITQDLVDNLGGRYVLYSVYLEGFLLFKVRYKDLHFWNEQMYDIFGKRLPKFPPKYYLAMTESMAEERRVTLEQYLQGVVSDSVISGSDVFITGLKKFQLETFKLPCIKVVLKVYLPDGRQVNVDSKTSDSAERVLEAALYTLNVSRELVEYFGLFITHKDSEGAYSVVKKIAPFEIPFITIWHINDDSYQIDIRKWYTTPTTDAMLMGCGGAIDLLYAQAVQELEMNWSRPTEQQTEMLKELIKAENKVKFLETMQQVEHYSYQKLNPGVTDYPNCNTVATVSMGNNEMYCSLQTSDNRTEIISVHVSKMTRCHVPLHQPEKTMDQQECKLCLIDGQVPKFISILTKQQPENTMDQQECKLCFIDGQVPKLISIRTKQAFLLSKWIKKMLSEQPLPCVKENLEIQDNITSSNILSRNPKKS